MGNRGPAEGVRSRALENHAFAGRFGQYRRKQLTMSLILTAATSEFEASANWGTIRCVDDLLPAIGSINFGNLISNLPYITGTLTSRSS